MVKIAVEVRLNLLILAVLLFTTVSNAEQMSCSTLYQEHVKSDLNLDYQTFDQTQGSGFRVLAQAGCHKEAADLIEAYIAANHATENSLRWHVAQLRATDGDSEAAISAARSVLKDTEDFSEQPLRWNDYVLATIAFLERDKEALIQHRNAVALGVDEYFGNELNLKLLDALIRHFDKDYAYATSHIEP